MSATRLKIIIGILRRDALDFPLENLTPGFSAFCWRLNVKSEEYYYGDVALDPSCAAGDLIISAITVTQIGDLTIKQ